MRSLLLCASILSFFGASPGVGAAGRPLLYPPIDFARFSAHEAENRLRVLGCLRGPEATAGSVLREGDFRCRVTAVHALRARGDQAAREALWAELRQAAASDPAFLESFLPPILASTLVEMGDTRPLDLYRDLLERAPGVQEKAGLAAALAELGDRSGLAVVLQVCRTADRDLRHRCIGHLSPFAGRRYFAEAAVSLLAEILLTEVHASDAGTRRRAANRLGALSFEVLLPESVLPRLQVLATLSAEEEVRDGCRKALDLRRMRIESPESLPIWV